MYSGNQKVFDGMLSSIISILKHNSDVLNIYILTVDLSDYKPEFVPIKDSQILFLDNLVKEKNKESFVKKIDMAEYRDDLLLSANVDTSYSPYTFLRLYADELDLPEKVLYLDVDIMAYSDIKQLYDIDVQDYEYAAALDYYGRFFFNRKYINAGVLLLNLAEIKRTGLFKKSRELCYSKKLFLPDQNALNRLTTKKLIIPQKFNSQKKLQKDTVIRHFSKTIKFFPYFHTINIKQWHIQKLHDVYKCFEFDDVLEEYVRLKRQFDQSEEKNYSEKIIPIFFASDKNYLPYLTVAIKSLVQKSKTQNEYRIYILTSDLTDEDFEVLKQMEQPNIKINRVDVNDKIESIKDKVALRDYYSVSIYFRLFIPTLFPQYKKAIYLDSDIILNRDIADMFNNNLGDNYVAAILDEVIWSSKEFTYYAVNALDVNEKQYFNSGVLVMNLDKFRENNIEDDFYKWVSLYNFGTVAPDQDYLNCICKNKVVYLDKGWNKMPMGEKLNDNELYLIHFNMFMKPWKYKDTMFNEYFWKYAEQTPFYETLRHTQNNHLDEHKINDRNAYNNLVKMAIDIANSDNTYKKIILKK